MSAWSGDDCGAGKGEGTAAEPEDLKISTPTAFKRGIHVEIDPATGALLGLPDDLRDALAAAQFADLPTPKACNPGEEVRSGRRPLSQLLPTNFALRQSLRVTRARVMGLLAWRSSYQQDQADQSAAEEDGACSISAPYNFRHLNHVVVDTSSPTGFRGLPADWEDMLKASGISKEQTLAHPQTVLDVLEFAACGMRRPLIRRKAVRVGCDPAASAEGVDVGDGGEEGCADQDGERQEAPMIVALCAPVRAARSAPDLQPAGKHRVLLGTRDSGRGNDCKVGAISSQESTCRGGPSSSHEGGARWWRESGVAYLERKDTMVADAVRGETDATGRPGEGMTKTNKKRRMQAAKSPVDGEGMREPNIEEDEKLSRLQTTAAARRPSRNAHAASVQDALTIRKVDPRPQFASLNLIGQGAGGRVFSATYVEPGRRREGDGREEEAEEVIAGGRKWGVGGGRCPEGVAVKVLDIARSADMDKLENEVAMMALSHHPNIVACLESFLWLDELWIVMELLAHGSLKKIKRHFDASAVEFGVPLLAHVCREVCEGLAFLHAQGRIHRDIKSDNILVGGQGIVKVADFGYCVQLTEEQVTSRMRHTMPNQEFMC